VQSGLIAPIDQAFEVAGRARRAPVKVVKTGFFDRLVSSRAWILLVAVLLVGLVAIQVFSLKLNASISKSVEMSAALEQSNAELEAEISRRLDPSAIRSAAEAAGLVAVDPNAVNYVTPNGDGSAQRALATLNSGINPNPLPAALPQTPAPVAPVTPQPVTATPVQPEPVPVDQQLPAAEQPVATPPVQETPTSPPQSVGGAASPTLSGQ